MSDIMVKHEMVMTEAYDWLKWLNKYIRKSETCWQEQKTAREIIPISVSTVR